LSGARHLTGVPAEQISIFFDDTFFWHYYVPEKRQEIIENLREGRRVRFLSRFYLTKAEIQLDFKEIRINETTEGDQLVYTDSKEYSYSFEEPIWEVTIHNSDLSLLNPRNFTTPIAWANNWGEPYGYQAKLQELLVHTDDLRNSLEYWASVDSTTANTRVNTPDSLPNLTIRSPTPRYFNSCVCGIDICTCAIQTPGTPPTPPQIELWKPEEYNRPIPGLHYRRWEAPLIRQTGQPQEHS
jgi:hypothetical protein